MPQHTYVFSFLAEATEANPLRATHGEAMINAWIVRPTLEQARDVARSDIEASGWEIVDCEHEEETHLQDYEEDEDLRFFEQAQLDHEVYVYHHSPRYTVFRVILDALDGDSEAKRVHAFILNENVADTDSDDFFHSNFWSTTRREAALSRAMSLMSASGLTVTRTLEQAPIDWLDADEETRDLCDSAEDGEDCFFFIDEVRIGTRLDDFASARLAWQNQFPTT